MIPTSTCAMKSPTPQSPILGSIPLSPILSRGAFSVAGHSLDDKPFLDTPPCSSVECKDTVNGESSSYSYPDLSHLLHTQEASTSDSYQCREYDCLSEQHLTQACLAEARNKVANMKQELQRAEDEIERLNAELAMSSFSWVAIQEACPEVSQVLRLPPERFLKLLESHRARVAIEKDGFEAVKKMAFSEGNGQNDFPLGEQDAILRESGLQSLGYQNLRELSSANTSPGSSVAAEDGSVCREDKRMTDIGEDDTQPTPAREPVKTLIEVCHVSQQNYRIPTRSRASLPQSPSPYPCLQPPPDHNGNNKALPYSHLLELYQTQCTALSTTCTDIEVVISSEESIRAKNAELGAKNLELESQITTLAICRADIENVLNAEEMKSAENVKLREVNEALERRVMMLLGRIGEGGE